MANTLSMKVKLIVTALVLALAAAGDFVNDLVVADYAQAQAKGHATGGDN